MSLVCGSGHNNRVERCTGLRCWSEQPSGEESDALLPAAALVVPPKQVHVGTIFFDPTVFSPEGEGFTLTPSLIHPKSEGRILLRSADPYERPLIEAGYLTGQCSAVHCSASLELAFVAGTALQASVSCPVASSGCCGRHRRPVARSK